MQSVLFLAYVSLVPHTAPYAVGDSTTGQGVPHLGTHGNNWKEGGVRTAL